MPAPADRSSLPPAVAPGARAVGAFLVSCEHGGNRIPAEYRSLFRGQERELASHRGYDRGALELGRELARTLEAPLVAATVSRLLVELNRSPNHRALYSGVTRRLPAADKARIIARYYEPYRREIEARVAAAAADGVRLLHVSAHSFTPVLDGETRATDVGLLYDPRRPFERALCTAWARRLAASVAPLRVRRNDPYRGVADGLTAYLRRRYADPSYAGVEVEVNQRHVTGRQWRVLCRAIATTLVEVLAAG